MSKFFGKILGTESVKIGITLNDVEGRDVVQSVSQSPYIFRSDEPVSGTVHLDVSSACDHVGVKIELLGEVVFVYDRNNKVAAHSSVVQVLEAGKLEESTTLDFLFDDEKIYESYIGENVSLNWYIKVTISRKMRPDITQRAKMWIIKHTPLPDENEAISMSVGLKKTLHIEFQFQKSTYGMKDQLLGVIYFHIVSVSIKYMQLSLIKREVTGQAPNAYVNKEVVTNFEVMDGTPVRGEAVPVRFFLNGYGISPTHKVVLDRDSFSVSYFLHIVLIDEDDRKYFKNSEIIIVRPNEDEPHIDFARMSLKKRKKKKKKSKKTKEEKVEKIEKIKKEKVEKVEQIKQEKTENADENSDEHSDEHSDE